MRRFNRKLIAPVVISLALVSCGGGTSGASSSNNSDGGGGGSGNNPTPTSTSLNIALNNQLRTPTSAYVNENSSKLQSNILGVDNKCFSLVKTPDDKNYSLVTQSSQWWSTAKLSFSIKNTCNTPQSATNLKATIQDFVINGSSVSNLGDIAQQGSPYMSTSATESGNNVSVLINTPACSGEWCSWAQVPAGGINTYTLNTSIGSAISTISINDVVLDGTPPPPPPPPVPGNLDLKVDSSKLMDLCKSRACNLKITVQSPAGQSTLPEISINPESDPLYSMHYTNLLPGNYTMQVDPASLPTGVGFGYTPNSGVVQVNLEATESGSISFSYVEPAKYASLNLKISDYSDLVMFSSLKNVNTQVTDTTSGKVYNISLPLDGSSVTLNNLPVNDKYSVMSQGLGDAYSGTFYNGINLTNLSFHEGVNDLSANFSKVAASHQVTTKITGNDNPTSQIIFADSGSISSNLYVYLNAPLKNNYNYSFPESEVAAVNITDTPGYSVSFDPKVIDENVNKLTVTFSGIIPPKNDNIVTAYLLIDTTQQLNQYINDLHSVNKVNFNRVVFSFVKPDLNLYQSGNLANTGILGYFGTGDGNGVEAFNLLKTTVDLSKAKHIEAFISVGGWNYSCNYAVYGSKCGGAPGAGINYDYFPDPTDPSQALLAKASYTNLITLATDLHMDGIDLDYEEFWHADKYAQKWGNDPWSFSGSNLPVANDYNGLLNFGTQFTTGNTFVMPKTVAKLSAIVGAIDSEIKASTNPRLKLAGAMPPVGATPIMDFVYGDNSKTQVYANGGVWWTGNLKGLIYNLAGSDPSLANAFDSMGLMSYDLAGNDAPFGGSADLASQVNDYVGLYNQFLKNTDGFNGSISKTQSGALNYNPPHFNLNAKIQFGFEVNYPAYGTLVLTPDLVNTILSQQKVQTNGVIIWQMYSTPPVGGTNTKYVLQQSCKTFLSNNPDYDCSANFPSLPSSH